MIEVQELIFSLIIVERATTMSSEIAKLREQIELEVGSMHQGLVGLAVVAKHQFIEARYRRLGQLEDELATHIGETQAAQFSCQAYIRLIKGE